MRQCSVLNFTTTQTIDGGETTTAIDAEKHSECLKKQGAEIRKTPVVSDLLVYQFSNGALEYLKRRSTNNRLN